MAKRVMVAVVCIPLLFLVIYGLPPMVTPIAVAVISAVSVYEALCSTGFLKHPRIAAYSIVLGAVIPFWVYYDGRMETALAGLFVYVFALFAEALASRKQVGLQTMGGTFFLAVVIPFFLSSLLRIRLMELWRFYIVLPFVIAFLSDAFALFAGMLFGKRKLAPELSPKKTVEGAYGGLFGAVLGALVFGAIMDFGFHVEGVRYPVLVVYGLLGSVVSQVGDLSFSYIKREFGLKDFGNIFPGHGGMLDRFDSVIFCAPLMELLLYFLPVVVS